MNPTHACLPSACRPAGERRLPGPRSVRALAAILLASAAALLPLAGPALALLPDGAPSLELPLPAFDLYQHRSPESARAGAEAAARFGAANGGAWSVAAWNPSTRTPHALFGSGVQVRAAFSSEEDAVAAAREILRGNRSVFGADVEQLRADGAPLGYGKRSVHFQQTWRGLDVHGGRVHLVFTEAGRLFAAGSDYHAGIELDPNPSVPAAVAGEIAARDLAGYDGRLLEGPAELIVLPVPESVTRSSYHLAWKVRVKTEEPLGVWATWVDAHDGAILWRYNEICFTDVTGTTSGQVQPGTWCNGQQPEAMPYLRVTVGSLGQTTSDADGNWSLPYGGSDPQPVTAALSGSYTVVNNMAGPSASFSGVAIPGIPFQVAFTNAIAQRDEMDVFHAINGVHRFYEDIDPVWPYLQGFLTAYVSIEETCNAYYWNQTINFYQAGAGCANTGEIQGVVYHEYGHGITEHILGDQGTQGIGEGNSDIIANYITGESIIGRGFYIDNCVTGIRNSENTLQYPEDLNGSIHHDGQIIAGFHWDSWQELQAGLPAEEARLIAINTWHWGRVHLEPRTQPDQVLATFIADDDDGDLLNGTPHYGAFCVGAANHGFECPEVLIGVAFEHEPAVSQTEPGDAIVRSVVWSTEGAIVPESTLVCYRVDGGPFQEVPMTPTGNPQEYAGTIPSLQMGNSVEYYLRSEDVLGNDATDPAGAPGNLWPFDIATIVDHFEEDSGWMINAEGTDNASSGLWNLVDPNGTYANGDPVAPENDRTPAPGVQAWITGQGSVGGTLTEMDLDGGRTSLYSPPYDLAGSSLARLKYWRWFSNDAGPNPGQDPWTVCVRNNGGDWDTLETTTASEAAWTIRDFDLLALYGAELGTIEVKFVAADYPPGAIVEAGLDEFEIQTAAPGAVSDWEAPGARFALLGGRPNPSRDATEVGFRLPAAARVRLSVHDVSGRLVRSLADGPFEAGLHRVAWDGRDASERPVPSGVYYLRMASGGFRATRSLVVAR